MSILIPKNFERFKSKPPTLEALLEPFTNILKVKQQEYVNEMIIEAKFLTDDGKQAVKFADLLAKENTTIVFGKLERGIYSIRCTLNYASTSSPKVIKDRITELYHLG